MAQNRLYTILQERLRKLFERKPHPDAQDIAEVTRAARAQYAGEASGAARQQLPAEPTAAQGAPSGGVIRLGRPDGAVELAAEDEIPPVYVGLRLDDGDGNIPEWQVYHAIGDHGIHPRFGRIVLTDEMADQIIRNHAAGVLGRGVPLDVRHQTGDGGEAGGWAQEFRRGRRGEVVPSGSGDLLYGRFTYNDIGRRAILSEHYHHQSPEYDRDYQGHGCTALALALTNNPFLKGLRTLQGREQLPVVLDDGLDDIPEEDTMPEPEGTQPQTPPETPTAPPLAPTTQLTMQGSQGTAVSLEEFQSMRTQLEAAQRANMALEQRVGQAERARYEEQINSLCDRAIYGDARGAVTPARANEYRAILLSLAVTEPTTVRLSMEDNAQPVSLGAALMHLLEGEGRVALGRRSAVSLDGRPATEEDGEAALLEAAKRRAEEVNAQRGHPVASTNGNHA